MRSRRFVSVSGVCASCSLSAIIRLFVHPMSLLSCRTRAAGALGVCLGEFAFCLFLCIQWTLLVLKSVVCSFRRVSEF